MRIGQTGAQGYKFSKNWYIVKVYSLRFDAIKAKLYIEETVNDEDENEEKPITVVTVIIRVKGIA